MIPYTALPLTAAAKTRGSVRIATASSPKPRLRIDPCARAAVCKLSVLTSSHPSHAETLPGLHSGGQHPVG
jgi:hypothetical protein